jgi:hypothetical protein
MTKSAATRTVSRIIPTRARKSGVLEGHGRSIGVSRKGWVVDCPGESPTTRANSPHGSSEPKSVPELPLPQSAAVPRHRIAAGARMPLPQAGIPDIHVHLSQWHTVTKSPSGQERATGRRGQVRGSAKIHQMRRHSIEGSRSPCT